MPAEQEPSIEGYVPSQWWFDLRQERDRLQTRVKSLEAEIQAAQELARDLIDYSGLREKVRLREDQTEYEEAERLIARTEEPSAIGEHLAEARAVEEHQERKHAERGDDEGLEPIETSPLIEREPDL